MHGLPGLWDNIRHSWSSDPMSWMTVGKISVLVAEKERKFQNKWIREKKSCLFQRSQLQKEVLCPEVWKGCSYKDWNPSLGQEIYTVLLVPGNLKGRKGARDEQVGMGKGGRYLQRKASNRARWGRETKDKRLRKHPGRICHWEYLMSVQTEILGMIKMYFIKFATFSF